MRVLIANRHLAGRTGTELYVRDLALGLQKRGHEPIAYSPWLGDLAEELRDAQIPVVEDLEAMTHPPDLIHGQHHFETVEALQYFPSTPAVYVCHSRLDWHCKPPVFPRILRYVAVDYACRECLEHASIPEHRIRVIFNGVDLTRFRPRAPLPQKPKRALVFSNGASERTFLPAVREACGCSGLELDVVGRDASRTETRPEDVLQHYDLVFAKARCAREAMAVGTAVVLLDLLGAGPMVSTRELDQLWDFNFGLKTLTNPISAETLEREISRYDANDATEVSRQMRQRGGLDETIDALVRLYHEVLSERVAVAPDFEKAALASYRSELGLRGRTYCWLYRTGVLRRLQRRGVDSWAVSAPFLRRLWRGLRPSELR